MAVNAVDSSSSLFANTATPTADATDSTATADRFLKLLVAQMQNQDPLNPMDNAQVTSQMAQINTVTGIDKLNTSVQGLSGQFVQMQALQGAALVGHDVIVPGNKVTVADGVAVGGFELANPADNVKVEVLSPGGKVVDTVQLGAQPSGMGSFEWNAGAATTGSAYTFRVTASKGTVNTAATTLVKDRVDAVSTAGNTLNLELQNSGTVAYAKVRQFN